MQSVDILSTTKDGDIIRVVKQVKDDDGRTFLELHTFNDETVEWRMAEYGVTDPLEAIDIILYSPYLDHDEPQLYDYPTVEEARTKIKDKIKKVKDKVKKPKPETPSNPNNPKVAGLTEASVTANLLAGIDDEYKSDDHPIQAIVDHSMIEHDTLKYKQQHIDSVIATMELERVEIKSSRLDKLRADIEASQGR